MPRWPYRAPPPPDLSKPYSAREVAGLCGYRDIASFYKARERLQLVGGLPPPFKTVGRFAWDRTAVDRWRAGLRVPTAANDTRELTAADESEWRARLAQAYGGQHG